jgi:hypothetical protein
MRHLGDPISRRAARPLGWYLPRDRAGYIDKVVSYGPIAYWVLNETAGATAADQINSPAQDGTYTGVTLADTLGPDGVNNAPLFDGANDFVNVQTAAFAAAFSGTEGTAMIWAKVFNAGVWTDGSERKAYRYEVDGSNIVHLARRSVCWIQWWSVADGNARLYQDGAEVANSPLAIAGVWGGNPAISVIGAQTLLAVNPWYGWLAHCAVWDSALIQAAITDLSSATP